MDTLRKRTIGRKVLRTTQATNGLGAGQDSTLLPERAGGGKNGLARTMSFVVGPIAGALVAGGVYFGFSNLIKTRTDQHRKDLHTLSQRLLEPPFTYPAPPPASARIVHQPFLTLIKNQWNEKLAGFYKSAGNTEERAVEWGRRMLYGGSSSSKQ
ncbi:hypothetical protein EW146_g8042 [Bondarzewia mesenterica]|uniref:MICOS complex subunit MIC12 n=1 Tax=Bondarzewia mesenterica TaxID=1095465 RepID=A0A4S4LN41_9AGAM|nr:hypothetical protein EW146_g8042 [Bondarzewia mesenterica]